MANFRMTSLLSQSELQQAAGIKTDMRTRRKIIERIRKAYEKISKNPVQVWPIIKCPNCAHRLFYWRGMRHGVFEDNYGASCRHCGWYLE